MTIPEVCVHVHMSDNRETMSEAENSWLPVDVNNNNNNNNNKTIFKSRNMA